MNASRHLAGPDRFTWLLLGAVVCLCATLALANGFRVDALKALAPVSLLAALVVAAVIGHRQGRPRLFAGATAFLQMTLFTVAGVVLAFVLAARAGTLWDPWLAAADRALGADWPALLTPLDRWPAAIVLLGVAYHSLALQMVVVIVALSEARRFATMRTMVAAAVLSGFATILISGAVPALGNLFDPARYHHLWPSVAWLERGLVLGLRDGSRRVLDLTILTGIVSFPSYHATLSAIFIWAWRDVPRLVRWMQVWAALTILATPVFGGHYLIDVVAGLLLAAPAVVAAKHLCATSLAPCEPKHATRAA